MGGEAGGGLGGDAISGGYGYQGGDLGPGGGLSYMPPPQRRAVTAPLQLPPVAAPSRMPALRGPGSLPAPPQSVFPGVTPSAAEAGNVGGGASRLATLFPESTAATPPPESRGPLAQRQLEQINPEFLAQLASAGFFRGPRGLGGEPLPSARQEEEDITRTGGRRGGGSYQR